MWKDKMKALLVKKEGGNRKKTIENLVVFILILIVTIISINTIWKDDTTENRNETEDSYKKLATTDNSSNVSSVQIEQDNLEEKLENILEKIEGVGNVNVLITYSSSSEVVPMYNESSKKSSTKEEDSGGGTRTVEENDISREIVYTEENGKNVPITKQIISPKIEGAIITADGAPNATVKSNIIQAVEAVTGIATHKIQVFEMKT